MGVGETKIWHSPPGDDYPDGLHSEAWHVGKVTGNAQERELSDADYEAVLKSMIAEGWYEDDADEWLAAFCMTPEIVEKVLLQPSGTTLEN